MIEAHAMLTRPGAVRAPRARAPVRRRTGRRIARPPRRPFHYDDANELTCKNAPTGGGDAWTYYAYTAFGEELERSGDAVTRFGYQGTAWMRLDSGLYVPPTQLYMPGHGRFTQRNVWPVMRLRYSASLGNTFGRWAAWALQMALARLVSRARRLRLNLYDHLRSSPLRLLEPFSEVTSSNPPIPGMETPPLDSSPTGESGIWDESAEQERTAREEAERERLTQPPGTNLDEWLIPLPKYESKWENEKCYEDRAFLKKLERVDVEPSRTHIKLRAAFEFEPDCAKDPQIHWETCWRLPSGKEGKGVPYRYGPSGSPLANAGNVKGYYAGCGEGKECDIPLRILVDVPNFTFANLRYLSCVGGLWTLQPKVRSENVIYNVHWWGIQTEKKLRKDPKRYYPRSAAERRATYGWGSL